MNPPRKASDYSRLTFSWEGRQASSSESCRSCRGGRNGLGLVVVFIQSHFSSYEPSQASE
jgi:hypothetical protein